MKKYEAIVVKKLIKKTFMHAGRPETEGIRAELSTVRRTGWPYCPADEGDLLFRLAKSIADQDALEVGFATGSTAAYILSGLESGDLTSIDYSQDQYEREGEALVRAMGYTLRHRLVECNSALALPEIYGSGSRFGLIFIDGWKTFDHIWVDTFYCAQMLNCGGYIVFDDARMPAVRKCISLLRRYYGFEQVDTYRLVGGWRQRIWHLLSTRSMLSPYAALQKIVEIKDTEAGSRFDFWRKF